MAESSPSAPPSLPSTADEVPYAPVSWLAVAAVGAAGLFLFLLLLLGYDAYRGKRPLLMPELLILAGIGVVLSFAARRVIRVSEGTRTGEKLTDIAWWGAVVGGVMYAAYWFAIEAAIRRDAEAEVVKWVGTVFKGELSPAFHRTLDPGRRTKLRPDDEAKLTAEFREPMIAFKQLDMCRVALRHPGECTFVPGGLRDWVQKPSGIECVFAGTVRSPEGTFPVHIPLKGSEGLTVDNVPLGRQWQIVPNPNGYVQGERMALTRYGWFTRDLEAQGGLLGRQFIALCTGGAQGFAYEGFVRSGATADSLQQLSNRVRGQGVAFGGTSLASAYTPDYFAFVSKDLFRLPGGGEPTPDQKKRFTNSWEVYGVVASGARLRGSPDTNDSLVIARGPDGKATAVEIRIPVELPIPGQEADMAAARGRLVVETTDAAALEKLNGLRQTGANPDQPEKSAPADFGKTVYVWRVKRIESDLYRVTGRPSDGPGGGRPGMGQ